MGDTLCFVNQLSLAAQRKEKRKCNSKVEPQTIVVFWGNDFQAYV